MAEPDIFEYADFRQYLDDWFNHRKAQNPRFSHRAFSKKLGSTDPSALANIVSQRRPLPEGRIADFCRVLGLEAEPATYFGLLVRYGQARDVEERRRAWAAIADFRMRLNGPNLDRSQFLYATRWIYPALRTLMECAAFRADPAWIGRTLRPPISEAEAAEALELLQRLGFVEQTPAGLHPTEPVYYTSDRVLGMATMGYHQDNHDLAGEALERLWTEDAQASDETAFIGFTVAIPSSRMGDLRRLLWELQLQAMHSAIAFEEPNNVVVQVNIQAFPVSSPIETEG